MKNKLLILLFFITTVSVFSQTVTRTIVYAGAQSQGCCNVCGQDYWCINNTGGCGTTAACDSRTFVDPVPAGNIITGVSITYFGAGCYASAEPSYINNVLIGSAPNDGNCACGGCSSYPTNNTFPCPTGLPSYNYGGVNTFKSCPNGAFCPQRVVITFTYTPVSIAPTGATATPNPSCGGAITLNKVGGSLGTGATWKWYSGSCGGTLQGTGASITVTPTTTTTYFIRAEGGGCGTSTCAQVTVTVNTPSTDPTSATASLTTTCGDPTTLTVTGGSLGTGASWKWYSTSCGTGLVGTGSSITVTPTNTTTYYVRAEGACNNTNCAQVTVTVNPVPFAIATPASATLCSGGTTSIALSSFVPATSFAWTVTQTGVTGASNGNGATIAQTLTASSSAIGTAVYTVTPTANNCVGNPITVTITVDPIPVLTATPSSQTICAGSVLPITLGSNVAGTSFTWTVVQTGLTGANSGSGSTTINDSLIATGGSSGTAIYTINGSANNCPGAAINDTITLNPDPGSSAIATPAASTICSGTSTSISLTSSVSGTIFTWTVNATGVNGAVAGTGATISQVLTLASPAVPGTVSYSVASTANGCTGSPITVTVNVIPTPTATVNPTTQTFCSGDTTAIALTSNVPGTSFSWTVFQSGVSGGLFGTDSVISQILTNSGSTSGTAVYTIIPSINGCAGSAVTSTITVTPLQDASFVYSSATYCTSGVNPTPIITGVQGGTFSSTPAGLVVNPTTGTITLATSQAGAYTLTYKTNGTCSDSSSITMTIDNSSPFSNFNYSASTYCQNGTNPNPIFGSGASAGVFSCSPIGLQFVSINTGEIDLANSNPGTYTVINHIPPSGNCSEVTDTVSVTITISDDASFVYSSATYCTTGNPQTPIVTGLSGGYFSATPAGLAIDSTTGTITLSNSSSGAYLLSYTTNGACPNSSSITMTIDTITPSATFSYVGSPFCQNGSSNPLPFFGPNASAGIFTATPAGLAFVQVNTGEIDLANSLAGTYTVTNTIPASGVCSPISDTYTIIIGPSDDASFVYTSATYCTTGPNQTPAITGLQGGIFTSIPPGLSLNPTTGTINLAGSTVGSYTLTYTTNGACPNSSSIVMTIADSTPMANFHYSSSAFCQNNGNQFPTFPLGASAGIFSVSPSGLVIVNVNTGELDLTNSTPGTYTITNTIPPSGICTEVVYTTTLIINPSDNASFTYPSATYCTTGGLQTPTITGLTGGTFSAVPPGLNINPTTGTINLGLSQIGSYTLSYTTFGTCPNTSSIVMTINDTVSSATFSYAGSPFCQSGGGNPYPTYVLGASAGVFSATPSGLVFVHINTGEIDLQNSAPGNYTVTNTIPQSGACAFVSATYTITINGAPSVIATPNAQAFCSSNTAALSIPLTSNIAGTNFTWTAAQSGVTGATAGNGTSISQTLTFVSNPGTVTYNISPSVNGCAGNDTSITIVIDPASADSSAILHTLANCGTNTGGVSGISMLLGQTPFTYQWKDSLSATVSNTSDLSNVGPGNYTLVVTDGNGCALNLGPFTVLATPPVVAGFTANPMTGQTPLTVNFTNNSTGASTYLWSFGTGATDTTMNPSYVYTPLGTFNVCLTAVSASNCVDSICDTINVYINSVFIIPNIFTPNGDDVNDIFSVHAVGLKTLDAEVYNRWGQKEYEWHTTNGGWDGRTSSGVAASDGTYYYIISATGIDGKKYFEKGNFSLVRGAGK
jgi:gliding motility-associated-like protein